jgi:amino acid permease
LGGHCIVCCRPPTRSGPKLIVDSNIAYFFWNGGPRSVSFGYLIVVSGVLCQVVSMAEMSSVQPIAGAQYHWTHYLAPPSHRRFFTWMQGWITWFFWISLLAGVANISALMIQALVIVVTYSTYIMVFLFFPSFFPVSASGINYALPINAFVQLVAVLLWYFWTKQELERSQQERCQCRDG